MDYGLAEAICSVHSQSISLESLEQYKEEAKVGQRTRTFIQFSLSFSMLESLEHDTLRGRAFHRGALFRLPSSTWSQETRTFRLKLDLPAW